MLRSRMQPLLWVVVLLACVAMVPANVFSAATGQIKGRLTDKETGEPIYGASVMVVGTNRGSLTDFDGRYLIKQLEPGTYQLKVSHLEYNTATITNVKVQSDITEEASLQLTKKVSKLDVEIVVKDERDILDIHSTSGGITMSKEIIEKQAVATIDDLLGQVTGVVTNNQGEVFIRGGRAFEVAYIVDGVPLNDPLGGLGQAGAALSLVSGSIQEFTVIKDGFDPEYGDALSGIVKITTQTGSKDVTRMNFQYITDDFGNEDLNEFSRNMDYARFSFSGPDPLFKDKILPALGINFLQDREFTYYFYAEVDKNDGIYNYYDYDTDETRRVDGAFNLLGFDIPERLNNNYYWMTNLKLRPTQNLKMIFSYKDSKSKSMLFGWGYRYSAATAPVRVDKWKSASLEISQSLSKNMNYEAIISFKQNAVTQKPGDPNNPGEGLDPDQFTFDYEWEDYEDRNRNGVYDAPEPIINLFPDTASYGDNYTGAAYTFGEVIIDQNVQGAEISYSDFRFNDNGYIDFLEGEPFIDLNGNGVWDRGDYLHDKNGNGVLDAGLESTIDQHTVESFTDGDSIIGEPFTDVNANNVYDAGVDIFIRSVGPDNMDYNHDGRYNGPYDNWEPGIPYVDRNGNGLYDQPNYRYDPGEPFVDVNGNGRWDGGGSSSFYDPMTYDDDATWHDRHIDTYRAEMKFFWQLGNHELKAGVAMKREDFVYYEIEKPYLPYNGRPDGGPYPNRGAFRDMFAYDPVSGTVYFRDKLEYGSMIANLGFRWDFFLQDKWSLVDIARDDDLGSGLILGDRQKFSPRIGFSYPISDKAKVHFNYGHFYQRPSLLYMYRRNTTAVNLNTVIGNYNLDYQKTIQYSFGVKYAMSENYSFDLSGYFKDEFNKVNSAQVRVGGLTRQQYQNSDYGRSRGFEFTLEKRGGGYVNGLLSYTYAYAYGKASQTNENYMSDHELSRDPLSEAPLDNDVRHSLKGSIQVYIPSTVKPRLFGLPIPNGWSMDIQTFIESGRPFTPSADYPDINTSTGEDIQRNSLRKPTIVNFDIRFSKDFKLAGLNNSFIIWVENIFDYVNVNEVYSNTGRADTQQNPGNLVKGGSEYDADPTNWDYGRQIRVGFEVNL